ncbi:type VI secretion system contractile sheath large subunit [Phyllobacterium sp. OV277]|uniref:type VI secretion system contractile sheath large subunit n=1 Tax=Phyllobacterium sp. OV277 TaxID=1882772 RepID=UPI00088C7646|nr:type VI secretion system contractile sheath large subunit [Phyllobacterium sp. OV277]SDP90119.1 type VI secretion system protein ImpD [Phyllobacterium sp. OV277]
MISESLTPDSKRYETRQPFSDAAAPVATATPDIRFQIDSLIDAIDQTLTAQVNRIIHHPEFQRLEALWRNLYQLIQQPIGISPVQIRVFSAKWKELARDIERAADFDQSRLFELIYSQEFDMPGGQPYGLLIGDYTIAAGINPTTGTDDIAIIEGISSVAAAAFSPFICAADPSLLEIESFADLDRLPDLSFLLKPQRSARWNRLRNASDTRFLGLTLPRILVRRPYRTNDITRKDGFFFREEIDPKGNNLLWGNSSFAFASLVLREYASSGWFADLRGVREDELNGGLVDSLPYISFPTDKHDFAAQPPIEQRLNAEQEQILSEAGFVPLATVPYTPHLVFNSNQSVHKAARYESEIANRNARIASMLQYVLCACRFAHYLKMIMRENVGQIATSNSLRDTLEKWLFTYCIGNDDADSVVKARHPLRSASVEVREIPGRPGVYGCVMRLQPHFQLDDVTASFQLLADMNSKSDQSSKGKAQ